MGEMEDKPAENGPPLVRRARLQLPDARGLHGREAAMLVKLERAYDADLLLECGGQQTNAKSIMGLLALEAEHCTELKVTAMGPDADRAIRAIEELFTGGFRSTAQAPDSSLFRQKFAAHFHLAH